jgi:hypothetical protein
MTLVNEVMPHSQLGKCLGARLDGRLTLRLEPGVTGTDRSCGHVEGTARPLFDYRADRRITSRKREVPWCSRSASRCLPTCAGP